MEREISFKTLLWWKTLFKIVALKESASNMDMTNSFVLIEGKLDGILVLRIAKTLLLFLLKKEADCSEGENAFLQYIDCSRRLDGFDKDLGCVSLR